MLITKLSLTCHSSAARENRSSFGFFHTGFLGLVDGVVRIVVGGGRVWRKLGKFGEIDESCFSR